MSPTSPRGPQPVAFDPRPLVEPVDRNAVRAFAERMRASGAQIGSSASTIIAVVITLVVVVFILTVFGGMASVFLSIAVSAGTPGWMSGIISVVIVVVFVLIIGVIVFAIVRAVRGGSNDRAYRLDGFARANGMTYIPRLNDPQLPGMIFGNGSDRHARDLVRGEQPRFVEFANYRYTTGSGKNRSTHSWGYVAVKLDVPLPHIVLDALGNDGLFGSNLPTRFHKDQRLSLEGDFDRYFSLYCPADYERDALYLFTPDIMVRFMDNAAALDVEIVDDWMFLYAKRDFSTLDPATWGWLFSVVAALLEKLAQWERWRDERLEPTAYPAVGGAVPFAAPAGVLRPPPGVAVPGRRLRRGIPWVAIIVGGIVLLMWIAPNFLGLIASLFGGLFGR
ncbi:MAG: hypothetical protein ABW091_14575 [Microbacterium sp.]